MSSGTPEWRKDEPASRQKDPAGADQQRQANANYSTQQSRQKRSKRHHPVRENVHASVDAAQQVRGDQFLAQADLIDRIDGKSSVTDKLGQSHQREDQG